jgi:hypothetical protein
MTSSQTAGARPHSAIRAAVAAASLAVAACFGAAIAFAQTPTENGVGAPAGETR